MLNNKVGLVAGASSGHWSRSGTGMAREGAKVVVSDLNRDGGEETVAHFGRLDVACNNAGSGGPIAPTADYPLDGWSQVTNINLSGVFFGLKYQIAAMLKNGGGSIINMASILGSVAMANSPAYTAAKHGVVGLTQVAALEYSAQGVRINAVGPVFIHTPMVAGLEADPAILATLIAAHPLGRLGRPEEVAELVALLGSDRALFVTGAYYPVDGGFLAHLLLKAGRALVSKEKPPLDYLGCKTPYATE